ncbi:MAG TPA: LLM class flavin-dependent oxidoreductase [Streptosporangiaceae bacterium]
MRVGMSINYAGGFAETVAELSDYEKAGLGIVFVPEAYSFDAVSQLGYAAARTSRVQIGGSSRSTPNPRADRDDRRRAGLRLRRAVRHGTGRLGPAGDRGIPRPAL